MNSERPDDGQAGPIGPARNWVSTFVDYLALKIRLFVIESTEATGHCIRLLILLGIAFGLTVASILTYGAFILYLVTSGLGLERSNLCHHTHSTGNFGVFAGANTPP
jgi:uncharacterized membrane protein YqjE